MSRATARDQGPDLRDRFHLLAEGEDRLDLQGGSDRRSRRADPAAAAQVLECVEENQIPPASRARSAWAMTSSALAPPLAAIIAESRTIPVPPAALRLSTVRIRSPPFPSLVRMLDRLTRGLEGAGDPGRDVHRDDLASGGEQRLVDGEEVADGGLRGGDGLAARPQAGVEVVVVGDLRLALLLAVDSHVEADQLDAVALGQLGGQVGGGVGDDRRPSFAFHGCSSGVGLARRGRRTRMRPGHRRRSRVARRTW